MEEVSVEQLQPDSTTSFLAASVGASTTTMVAKEEMMVTADTLEEQHFSDLFTAQSCCNNNQTMLTDVSAYLGNGDSVSKALNSLECTLSNSKKDILASALLSIDGGGNNNSDVEMVSSTIHGFPENDEEANSDQETQQFVDQLQQLQQQQQQQQPVIILSSQQQNFIGNPNDVYTLTLTDGSVVQLRVQNSESNIILEQQQPCKQEMWSSPSPSNASSSSPPPSVAEEITLPYSGPSSPMLFNRHSSDSMSSYEEDGESSSGGFDDDALLSMFSSMDSVTIEALKAHLTSLPEGQTDLGALLVAAKIELTVDDIVGPPLTQVKRLMEQNGLSDWQVQLCIKIRRRKKNTAAVRSSRRKRNQYVASLRQEVSDLSQRRKEAQEENALLKQLHSLWERLCSEVEAEIQEGVRKQLGMDAVMEEESPVASAALKSTPATVAPPAIPSSSRVSTRSSNLLLLQPRMEDTVATRMRTRGGRVS